ncbi:MAG: hypothetical protein ACXIUM_01535 [Wenzhouxiangella sp.]
MTSWGLSRLAWRATVIGSCLLLTATVAAETTDEAETRSATFEIRWHTISAGGGSAASASGDFQLRGTIGQHDASADHPASSANYSHRGGFWVLLATRGRAVVDRLFRDRFQTPVS